MTIIANAAGVVTGTFTIPPSVPAGSKTVAFTGAGGSYGTGIFTGQGQLTVQTLRSVTTVTYERYDPLAQTFTLEKNVQLAGVDLWFTAKNSEVRVQLRETSTGFPTRTVLAEASLAPADIVVSGGGHTRVLFPAPVLLSANTEYAVVILCDDPDTALAVAEMGKFDAVAQKWVSSQPYTVGVLLSSSNASTWTAHQDRDLAFRLLGAVFAPATDASGTKTVDLGAVPVADATDMMLMSLAEIPSAQSRVTYEMTLPGTDAGTAEVMTVAEGQPVRFAVPVTGNVGVKARLVGDADASPVLYPGSQLVAGRAATTADYVTRAVSATGATRAVLVYNALIPSGATVTPAIRIDSADYTAMTADGATQQGDGVVEYRFVVDLSGANLVRAKLELSGTATARPEVSDIRFMAVQ